MRTKAEEDPVVAAASIVRAGIVADAYALETIRAKLQKGAVRGEGHRRCKSSRNSARSLSETLQSCISGRPTKVVAAAGKLDELPLEGAEGKSGVGLRD